MKIRGPRRRNHKNNPASRDYYFWFFGYVAKLPFEVDTARVVNLLVTNLLISREPVYGVADWARDFDPELFDLQPKDIERLNDDRVGPWTGAVYQFCKHDDGVWLERDKLFAADGNAYDYFGSAVALSRGIALIGAPGNSRDIGGFITPGAAYVFPASCPVVPE